ncbi:MAG: HAMP domain-containing histidine kinase [Alistipes sp.]|nr:HAMP domain-containing histidine kinase [Alistipes sp.]MDE6861135.1 HAMP domain-containing histidine kinase [Alistipes sp.]
MRRFFSKLDLSRKIFSTRRRTAVIIIGLVIAALSVLYTSMVTSELHRNEERTIEELRAAERNGVELWADILRSTNNIYGELVYNSDLFANLVRHTSVPFVITDEYLNVVASNLPASITSEQEELRRAIERMADSNKPIIVRYNFSNRYYTIYYGHSRFMEYITQSPVDSLIYFPYVQLLIILIFAAFTYIAFSSTRQNEQNRVWVGLAKETAHQLGTPTSSLLGWVEYLRSQPVDPMAVDEMSKDLAHLMKIVDRFSKIGSETMLTASNINEVVGDTVMYFRKRIPRNVTLTYNGLAIAPIRAQINAALFEWVIENLLKNALDALQGHGCIDVFVGENDHGVYVEVRDTGKGIPKSNWNKIFAPGFTTKTRGWGLGLSLSRRIVEEYHSGKIAVVRSEPGKGTTIRVTLKRLQDNE